MMWSMPTKMPVKALYASASHDDNTGDVILKVVNASAEKIDTAVHLKGAGGLPRTAQAIVLTSDNPTDENSLEAPDKVSPKTQTLSPGRPGLSTRLSWQFSDGLAHCNAERVAISGALLAICDEKNWLASTPGRAGGGASGGNGRADQVDHRSRHARSANQPHHVGNFF